jgi:hemoglobin
VTQPARQRTTAQTEADEAASVAAKLDRANDAARDPDAPPSMYDEIGGALVVRRLVEWLYYDIRHDDMLWLRYFDGVSLARVKSHMVALLSQLLGGPKTYTGGDLHEVHASLHITLADYNRVGDYLVGNMWRAHAPAHVIHAVADILGTNAGSIVTQ